MNLADHYSDIGESVGLSESRAVEVIVVAHPLAAALLPPTMEVRVTARLVKPVDAIGGSLIPAWPVRHDDDSVTIEFVDDWGAMLAAWRDVVGETDDPTVDVDSLLASGERQWVGIANDVLQMYVTDPPPGTYSMVRHHALMLAAATLWLGPERAERWRGAHATAARSFIRALHGRPPWEAIEAAERGLSALLRDPRARQPARSVIEWLDGDDEAANRYRDYLGAASLGLAALLGSRPIDADPTEWTRDLVQNHHRHADFNRDRIEAFAETMLPRS